MNHSIRTLILMLVIFIALPDNACSQVKRKEVVGDYSRNTAEGWRRYTDPDGTSVEVIPDIPYIEYLYLRRLGKSRHGHVDEKNSWEHKGKWKVKNDTVSIIYVQKVSTGKAQRKKVRTVKKYHFTSNCGLHGFDQHEKSFYRVSPLCY